LPGLVAVPAELLVTGVAAVLPEPVVARWTLTAAPPEPAVGRWALTAAPPERVAVPPASATAPLGPVAVPVEEVGVPVEPAGVRRWTPVAALLASLGPVAVPPGPSAVRPGPVGVPAGSAVVRLVPAAARWTSTALPVGPVAVRPGPSPVLLERVAVPAGLVGVLPGPAAAFWTRAAALSGPVVVGAVPVVAPPDPVVALPDPVVARWTLTTALPGLTGAASGPVVVLLGPVVVSARSGAAPREPAAARWTSTVALPGPAGVASGMTGAAPPGPGDLSAGAPLAVLAAGRAASPPTPVVRVPAWDVVPVEAAGLGAGPTAGPPGRVAWAPWSVAGRTGPGAGLPGRGAVPVELGVARWTLTAAPLVRVAGLPGPVGVPPVPADRLPEPVAVPPLDTGPTAPVGGGLPGTGLPGVGLPEAADVPAGSAGPAPEGRPASTAAPAAGAPEAAPAPGPPVSDAVRSGVPVTPPVACRRAAGRARRCTAGVAGALVNGFGRWDRGGTGVTRGPAGRDAVTGRGARWTGTASSRTSPGASGSSDLTGSRVCEGGSSPGTGLADVVSAFLTSPPGAPSRTAWDKVPVKEGFCQVLSRPPKPESATPVRPAAARWIGGNPAQPATVAGPDLMAVPASAPVGDVLAPVGEEPPS
jgi:hypothetical protein